MAMFDGITSDIITKSEIIWIPERPVSWFLACWYVIDVVKGVFDDE